MGGGVISFGFCVTLVCIIGKQNAVQANPMPAPAPYDICWYLRHHHHRDGIQGTTTAAPTTAEVKPSDDKKGKLEQLSNWLRDFLDEDKEAEKKKEEDKKKKEEEEKKKKEEEAAKKDTKKDESRGFKSMDDFWERYIKFLTALYYSF